MATWSSAGTIRHGRCFLSLRFITCRLWAPM
jgi:hypothetical protein